MGTNYYWHQPACKLCGRASRSLHIGKSSGGWAFSLRVHPGKGINNLDDWKTLWARKGTRIDDEYGQRVMPAEMLMVVTERDGFRRHPPTRGVTYGPGSYDYCDYEFS